MKILCKSNSPVLKANQQVNRVGKYLFKNIDGAFKYETTSNMCDVYFKMLYQVPRPYQIPGKQKEGYNDVHEIVININITTYQNKVRVNIIEVTPTARTLGYNLFAPEKMVDLESAKQLIWQKVVYQVSKAYKDYDFVF